MNLWIINIQMKSYVIYAKIRNIYIIYFIFVIVKKNICPLCIKLHNKQHNMIEYNNRFNFCIKHNKIFLSYCDNCNINLCEKCEEEHYKHKRISYKEMKQNDKRINEIKNEISEIKIKIKKYKMEIKKLNNLYIKNMNNILNDLDKYYFLYENIYKSIDNLNNYESIKNLNNLKNNKLIKDIDEFLNDNIINKYKRLINIIYNTKNEMTIIYENKEKIKLFGEIFI